MISLGLINNSGQIIPSGTQTWLAGKSSTDFHDIPIKTYWNKHFLWDFPLPCLIAKGNFHDLYHPVHEHRYGKSSFVIGKTYTIVNHLQMGEFPLFARVCREKTNCTQSSIKMERVLHVSPHLPFGSQSWQLNICHKWSSSWENNLSIWHFPLPRLITGAYDKQMSGVAIRGFAKGRSSFGGGCWIWPFYRVTTGDLTIKTRDGADLWDLKSLDVVHGDLVVIQRVSASLDIYDISSCYFVRCISHYTEIISIQ